MIELQQLAESAARHAIENGEFPAGITRQGSVAVVMTQDWCVEWLMMRSWLNRMARNEEPSDLEISVYTLIYNRVSFFGEFMKHKEEIFGNRLIPYVRYYRDGELIGESNAVGAKAFLGVYEG